MEECLPSRAATWVSCSMSQFTVLAAIFVATFLQQKIGINSLGNVSGNKQQHSDQYHTPKFSLNYLKTVLVDHWLKG
jgi:hypothetical protein